MEDNVGADKYGFKISPSLYLYLLSAFISLSLGMSTIKNINYTLREHPSSRKSITTL